MSGVVGVVALALLVLGANAVRSAPLAARQHSTDCVTTAAAESSPEAETPEPDSGSSGLDRILESSQRVATERAEARATAEAIASGTPAADACVTPEGSPDADSLQTAAAVLAASTATAEAAAEGDGTQGGETASPAATEAPAPTEEPAPTETPAPPATEAPAPPTETPAPPPPTETPPPEAGEITAALPPADIPSTNPQGYSYNLEANLTANLGLVQTDAAVYRLAPIALNLDQVAQLATSLGITGPVEDRGGGTFAASGNGELFVTPSLIQYLSPQQPADGELPTDDQAVTIASDWLRTSSFVQPDLGPGKVVSRDEPTKRVVVVFTPVQPANLLAAYPSINISLGPGGAVLSVASHWGTIQPGDIYQLLPAEEAWRQVEAGQAYIEASLEGGGFQQGTVVSGVVEYSNVEIGYTTGGPPGGNQYLLPIFVFSGRLTPEGTTESYPIRAFVPALAISDQPVG